METKQLNQYIEALDRGELILLPTDHTNCLACHLFNESGISSINAFIDRTDGGKAILIVSDIAMLKRYVKQLHPRIETLLVYHRRPIIIYHEVDSSVSHLPTNEKGEIGIRVSHHRFCKTLINHLGQPLIALDIQNKTQSIPFDQIPARFKEASFYLNPEVLHYAGKNRICMKAKYDEEGQLNIIND